MLLYKLFAWRNLLFVNSFCSQTQLNIKGKGSKVVITFVATVLLFTAVIPSEFGILIYKDFTSRDTKYESSVIVSIVLIFRRKSPVSCI